MKKVPSTYEHFWDHGLEIHSRKHKKLYEKPRSTGKPLDWDEYKSLDRKIKCTANQIEEKRGKTLIEKRRYDQMAKAAKVAVQMTRMATNNNVINAQRE